LPVPGCINPIFIDSYTTYQIISTKKRKAGKFALTFVVAYLRALSVICYFHEISSGFYRQREIVIILKLEQKISRPWGFVSKPAPATACLQLTAPAAVIASRPDKRESWPKDIFYRLYGMRIGGYGENDCPGKREKGAAADSRQPLLLFRLTGIEAQFPGIDGYGKL
jgi:hypothetical protein